MTPDDTQRIQAFLEKWQGSEGNERANYQTFFGDLCLALGVDSPPPKGSVVGDPYCFDKDIKFYSEKADSTRFADFYKEGCFLIEAKQGSAESGKGHGKRGTKVYQDNLQKAFNQAKSYAYNRMLPSMPPFLLTCDIGSHFEIWQGFSGEYGSYGARQRVNLTDLKQPEVFDRFVKIFTDPQSLNPEKYRARVTREVAAELAKLSRWLEDQGHGAEETANFLMRCIFTMFAEDVEMLKGEVFTKALRDRWIAHPATFKPEIEQLWQTMNTGGSFGFERILQFNGSFFENATAIALPKEQLEVLYAAAAKDWSQVEPAIFGTLLERALEKKERSRLGAHYTPRSYVERLVRPVVMEPLRQEWDEIELELKRLLEPAPGAEEPTAKKRKDAEQEIRAFLDKLRTIKILDPACGTGNFLYVSLDLLKGLEAEVQTRLVDVAGNVQLNVLEQINPSQFLGIELNPRAAAIAELVIWIGYLQWYFKRYGNAEPPEPVLQAFGNIENRDAVLAYDGTEPDVDAKTGQVRTRWGGRMMRHPVTGEEVPDPTDQVVIYRYLNAKEAEWPQADYVVSNPPFIGKLYIQERLGEGYVKALRDTYKNKVPDSCDLVMYWWYRAAQLASTRKLLTFGFVTTKGITQTFNRRILEDAINSAKSLYIKYAIPNHPWLQEADTADVRIAMTVVEFGKAKGLLQEVTSEEINPEAEAAVIEFSNKTGFIQADLTIGPNVKDAVSLKANACLSSVGVMLGNRGFLVDSDSDLYQFSQVIKPILNGNDVMKTCRNLMVIDFFDYSAEEVQAKFPEAFQQVLLKVKPERDQNNRASYRKKWWLFIEPRARFRPALKNLSRYIVTPETARYRVFQMIERHFLPEHKLVAIACEDAWDLGVLSSRVHVTWSLAAGGRLGVGNDPVYSKTSCFDPFPFPDPTPEQKQKIRDLGERLDTHRKQVQATHPDITITGMYNLLEKLRAGTPFTDADRDYNNKALVSTLKQIHDELDTAVLDAYGWPHTITDEQILENLVALNAERAAEERNGHIRWLRPEYQAPNEVQTQQVTLEGLITPEEPVVEPVEQQKWPTQPKEQLAAIRDLLRTQSGEWTVKQIAAQFTGRATQNKLDAITENLERLEWFGIVIPDQRDGITYWHYAESSKVA
jgi:hypothetical protein